MLAPEDVLTPQAAKEIKKKHATIGPYDFKSGLTTGGPDDVFLAKSEPEIIRARQKNKGALIVVGVLGHKPRRALLDKKTRQFLTNSEVESGGVQANVAATLRAAASLLSATPYDPHNPEHRAEFATKLKHRLESAGFKLEDKRSRGEEDIYTFQHRKDPGLIVKVMTSSAGGKMREKAADAIRVMMFYQQRRHGDKKVIPIVPPTPPQMKAIGRDPKMGYAPIIKRMPGTPIDKLVERVVSRAREAYIIVNELERCNQCTAPMAFKKMKKGDPIKRYCAELCWTAKQEQKR